MQELPELIRALHTSGRRFVFSCTAGLSGASLLVSQPGASSSILEVTLPYHRRSFLSFIAPQPPPASFASSEAALSLARSSLRRARALCQGEGPLPPLFGIGSAGALASLAPKAGDHRCHIALCSDSAEEVFELRLSKGGRGRPEEEALCGVALVGVAAHAARLLPEQEGGGLRALLERCGFGGAAGMPGDELLHRVVPCAPPLQRLHSQSSSRAAAEAGEAPAASLPPLGSGEPLTHVLFTSATQGAPNAPLADLPRPLLMLCGSFNPLHIGHVRMAMAAVSCLARQGSSSGSSSGSGSGSSSGAAATASAAPPPPPTLLYEISMENVDKPPLTEAEVERRVAAFFPPSPGLPSSQPSAAAAATPVAIQCTGVLVTRAPRFIDKAALCPGATFVCGFDTAARLITPRYYGGGRGEMEAALGAMLSAGCRVLVAGRSAGAAPLPEGWAGPPPSSPEEFLTLGVHLLPLLPGSLRGLFAEIPESQFREDVSSREIRERGGEGGIFCA